MNDLTARIDAAVEMLLNREAQHVTALFPDQSCALRALLVEARAQIAAQAEALAKVREAGGAVLTEYDANRLRPIATLAEQDRMKATREVVQAFRDTLGVQP